MQIGSKLKRIRENKRMSQQEIAAFLEISQKTYSNIESDKSKPSLPQLSKLSESLDFDLLELLQEQGIVFNQKKNKINGIIHNNFPFELKEQYEARINDLQEINMLLKDKIISLENN